MKHVRSILTVSLMSLATVVSAEEGKQMPRILGSVPTFHSENDTGWMRFFGALTSVMRHGGEKVDYAYLMGTSAAAFRLKIDPKEWHPGAQAPEGDEEIYPRQALTAMGYTGTFQDGRKLGKEALAAMRKHIDKGIPPIVSGTDLHPAPDFSSVVTGYEGKDKFFFFSYNHKKDEYEEGSGDKLLGRMLLVEKTQKPLEPLEALRQSLQLAIRMASTKELNGFAHGSAAFDAWIARLRDKEDDFAQLDQEKLKGEWWRNAMNYEGLCDARGAARRYLLRVRKGLPVDAAEKLQPLVEKYEQIQKLVFENWKWFPFPHWVNEKANNIWTPLGTVEGTTWSSEIRKRELEALKAIWKTEEEAFQLMGQFLKGTE